MTLVCKVSVDSKNWAHQRLDSGKRYQIEPFAERKRAKEHGAGYLVALFHMSDRLHLKLAD